MMAHPRTTAYPTFNICHRTTAKRHRKYEASLQHRIASHRISDSPVFASIIVLVSRLSNISPTQLADGLAAARHHCATQPPPLSPPLMLLLLLLVLLPSNTTQRHCLEEEMKNRGTRKWRSDITLLYFSGHKEQKRRQMWDCMDFCLYACHPAYHYLLLVSSDAATAMLVCLAHLMQHQQIWVDSVEAHKYLNGLMWCSGSGGNSSVDNSNELECAKRKRQSTW